MEQAIGRVLLVSSHHRKMAQRSDSSSRSVLAKEIMSDEFVSMTAIHMAFASVAPTPIAWGAYVSDTTFIPLLLS